MVPGFGKVIGDIGPPPLDAAPVAVGLELSSGELGDPVELGVGNSVLPPDPWTVFSAEDDDPVIAEEKLGQGLGLGGEGGELRQIFGHLPAQFVDSSHRSPSLFEPDLLGLPCVQRDQLLADCNPSLERDRSSRGISEVRSASRASRARSISISLVGLFDLGQSVEPRGGLEFQRTRRCRSARGDRG